MTEPLELGENDIDVVVPVSTRFASIIRTVASSVAADVGFSVDEIEDLRLALNEAFSLFHASAEGSASVRIRFTPERGSIRAVLLLQGDGIVEQPDELAASILRSTVTTFELETSCVSISKRAEELASA